MTDSHPPTRPISHQYELAVLGEECGEVIQIVGKTMRFGYESHDPNDPLRETNLDLLHKEVGDILAAVDFAVERGLLDREQLVTRQFHKRRRLMQVAPRTVLTDTMSTPIHTPAAPEMMPETVAASSRWTGDAPKRESIRGGIVLIMAFVLIAMGMYLFGGESKENESLTALRNYQQCLSKNTAPCDDLARAAGIEVEETVLTPDDVVAGSR